MAQKLEAKGGKGGKKWDDLGDHENVAKVYVRGGYGGIQFIKFDYVKNGKVQNGSLHGLSGRGFTQTFDIDHLNNEYLQGVEGYYDEVTNVIQGIKLKSNLKTSELMGDDSGSKFSLAIPGKQIIGFHGFADTNLNSLGAYFRKVPTIKVPYEGGPLGSLWDHGGGYDGVIEVNVSYDVEFIRHLKFDYDKGGQVETLERITCKPVDYHKFVVNYPNDYITSVEGTVGKVGDFTAVTSLIFKTFKGVVSPTYGNDKIGRKFVLESKGRAVVGFHGKDGGALDAIGVYCGSPPPLPEKVPVKGGKGGKEWDDLADHDNVAKVYVRGGYGGIQFIKFDYVKHGKVQNGSLHGLSGKGFTQTFDIDYLNNEYLQGVEGYYDEATNVIQGIKFKTNLKTSDLMGDDTGNKFSLAMPGKMIIGFHGFAETNLNSLGAYFSKVPTIKVPYEGGPRGSLWDHGGGYDGVIEVNVSYDVEFIRHLKFDYDKGGQVETLERITCKPVDYHKFVVNYPNDYITSVEGTVGKVGDFTAVTSLIFKTSKGVISPTYGNDKIGRKFVLESKGRAVVGFHGKDGGALDAIGVYCGSPPPPPPPVAEKLPGKGFDAGDQWDDGVFDGVKKIFVGQGLNGITTVKFVYNKDFEMVEGNERGKKTLLAYDEFEVDYPTEYITAVEGCFDKIHGSESGIITMLKFKTNKRTSPPFGLESTSSFVIEKEGYKIVGFHGKASHEIHQLGVHVVPL